MEDHLDAVAVEIQNRGIETGVASVARAGGAVGSGARCEGGCEEGVDGGTTGRVECDMCCAGLESVPVLINTAKG